MSWLWGKKKKEPVVNAQVAADKNAETIDNLNKKIEQLEKQEELMAKEAKQAMAKKNKKKALQCMKRKKLFENQATKLIQIRDNLEINVYNLQQAKLSTEAFESFAVTTQAMKNSMAGWNAEKIDEIRETNEEVMDNLNEMTEIITAPGQDAVDEDELLGELGELMEQDEIEEPEEAQASTSKPVKDESDDAEAIMAAFN